MKEKKKFFKKKVINEDGEEVGMSVFTILKGRLRPHLCSHVRQR
jgi:sporulation protein YlmC with PRC-barrel domain